MRTCFLFVRDICSKLSLWRSKRRTPGVRRASVRTVVVLVQEAGRSEFAASPGRVWCGSVERLIDEYAERTFFHKV